MNINEMNINELREMTREAQAKISYDFSQHPIFKYLNNAMQKAAKAGKYDICLNFNECLHQCGCNDFPLDDARVYFLSHGFDFQSRDSCANSCVFIVISWA